MSVRHIPSQMNWGDAGVIVPRSDEYYVKLQSIDDWLNAVVSIRAGLPKRFATEIHALHASWNLRTLVNQGQIFAFKPIGDDTTLARTLGAAHKDDNPSENLRIAPEEYQSLVGEVSKLRVAYEDALLNSDTNWQPSLVETVLNLLTVAHRRFEQSAPSAQRLRRVLYEFQHMLEHLTKLERQRIMMETGTMVRN